MACLSGYLHHNIGDHIGSFITAIGGIAQVAVDLAQLQHLDYMGDVFCPAEEVRQGLAIDILHPVFKGFSSLGMLAGDAGVFFQPVGRHRDFIGRIPEQGGHALHERGRFHLQDFHLAHGAVGIIEHIVDGPRKREDILPVKRGNEGFVQFVDQDAPGFIGIFFTLGQVGSRFGSCPPIYAFRASIPCRVSAA